MIDPPLRWSRRLPWEHPTNRLTRAVAERKARGLPVLDLTETNPTRVGIPYPEEELAEILRRSADPVYEPHPRGSAAAREALAASLSCSPDDLVLTASTSESYSYLFKLFGDPGDQVLTEAALTRERAALAEERAARERAEALAAEEAAARLQLEERLRELEKG